MITEILLVLARLLHYYAWAVIIAAIFTTLVSVGVLDTRNRVVWTIGDFLYRITEPALRPLRNILPVFGSVDLSPLALILLIWLAEALLGRIIIALESGSVGVLFF